MPRNLEKSRVKATLCQRVPCERFGTLILKLKQQKRPGARQIRIPFKANF